MSENEEQHAPQLPIHQETLLLGTLAGSALKQTLHRLSTSLTTWLLTSLQIPGDSSKGAKRTKRSQAPAPRGLQVSTYPTNLNQTLGLPI